MDFEAISETLSDYSELESPSFLQGMLAGLIVGAGEISEAAWIKKLLQEAGVKKIKESLLKTLHEMYLATENGLNSSGFEFELCLPDDDQDIPFRAAMVAQWAEGFLYGFGLSERDMKKASTEVKEFIEDLQEIARLDAGALADEESSEAEADLMEIIEFIRMGVLMVNEELNPKKGQPIMDPAEAMQAKKGATIH
jgi:yecA family protein